MKLNAKGIMDQKEWGAKGYGMPRFDRDAMVARTIEAPVWIHFGAGNIFRGFPAMLMQHLLDSGLSQKGIVVGEGFDYEIIDKIYVPHDDLSLLVTLKADGTIDKTVVGSVAAAYKCDSSFTAEWKKFQDAFASSSLQMVSFTITEKGYGLKGKDGAYMPFIVSDMHSGPEGKLSSMMSKVTALVYHRYLHGAASLALCSMDNCSHNGEKLETAVKAIAEEWVKNGFCEEGFLGYLGRNVSFPWSMIDKIIPAAGRESPETAGKGRVLRYHGGGDGQEHLYCSVRQRRKAAVFGHRGRFPQRKTYAGKGRSVFHRQGYRQQGGEDEGLHLPQSVAYGPRCLWLPSRIYADCR